MKKYLENDELSVNDFKDACTIAEILLKNGNAVMLTTEEDLFIVNWIWCESGYADRNDVVFRDRASVEDELFELMESEDEDEENDEKRGYLGRD